MPPRVEALGAAALVARLQAHSAYPVMQAQCLLSLCERGLSGELNDESALSFWPAILAALRAHPGHAVLQKLGCAALTHTARASSTDALVSAGCADVIHAAVCAMQAHPADANVQVSGCCLLDSFARSAELRDILVSAGAVRAVAAALHAHVLYEDVACICEALSRITVRHPAAMAQAGAAGAVAAALAVLHTHSTSALLQTSACAALGSLAYDADNQKRAIHAGAMEAVVHALRAHTADAMVQIYGCRALGNIAEGHVAVIRTRSSGLVCDAITAAVVALSAHCADASVMEHTCSALSHLLVTDADRVDAGKAGAVTAVVAALRAHAADANLQRRGCCIITHLSTRNSRNAVAASAAGAFEVCASALRAHPDDVNVQVAAVNSLGCMLQAHPRLQAAAGAAGAVEAIVDAMRVPVADARLLAFACEALLRAVQGHRGNAQRSAAAGDAETFAVVMVASCAQEVTVTTFSAYDSATRALDALLDGNEDAARRAIHAGVLDIMARQGGPTQRSRQTVVAVHDRVLSLLQAAAQRHDAAVCVHDGCKRCAAARDAGRVCALPGCGARKRGDGSGKTLLRCGACRRAAFCGAAHQREDWERHKTECAALRAADDADE
jgi:hypothetical protein